jgi:phosphoribosylaminoimidazolecarboxamide formyltransferase / IMP cyclohydrolase
MKTHLSDPEDGSFPFGTGEGAAVFPVRSEGDFPAKERSAQVAGNIVEKVDERVPVRNALVSVSDKQGLDFLVKELTVICPGVRILSTGGTFSTLRDVLGEEARTKLIQVSAYTGQPETQGGLVKTLDFKIYLGLLTETYNPAHQEDLARTGAVAIDLVVVNLYPFQKTVEREDATLEKARANIDIGGPCMLRASAKNFHRVAVVVDPGDYPGLLSILKENGGCTRLQDRFRLARKAFEHTADYDRNISGYLNRVNFSDASSCYQIEKGKG